MSLRHALRLVLPLLLAAFAAACASAEPQRTEAAAEEPAAEPMDMEAMMAEYVRLGSPGEHHERMARMAGDWTVAGKMWMEPGQPPTDATGGASFTVELGGRWIRQVYESSIMGQPFRGFSMDGYDNATGKYVSYWFDSMSTACFIQEGSYDAATRTMTAEGSHFDPITRETKRSRTVFVERSDDEFVMTMYELVEGAEPMRNMELVYTRRK